MRALETDLYQLTMAAGYFHRGLAHTVATCELSVRRLPRARRYLVACGIDQAIDYLMDLRFEERDIAYMREVPALAAAMNDAFVEYLREFRFRGDVWAVPEGTVVFAGEPLIRVRAPIIEAQIVETHLLSVVNHATMVASKAARIVQAAAGRRVLEFGTRRTHPAAALSAARAAYLVGAAGTSNVEAGRRFDIPVVGTAAHMWTMTHDSEEEAFANYLATFPDTTTLLIDTYDTLRGAERAARGAGDKLRGVRLDSGDLAALSRDVRRILDEAGCTAAQIMASGDLDEYKIAELVAQGAPIDSFGVGTELVSPSDACSLGGVYKVVEFERDGRRVHVAKRSEGKVTYPGAHQVYRQMGRGRMTRDTITLSDEERGDLPLLEPHVSAGRRLIATDLQRARSNTIAALHALPAELNALEPSEEPVYEVRISDALRALAERVWAAAD